MKVTCPSCAASGRIDKSNLPQEGRLITCPKCQKKFQVVPERSGVEIIQQREVMACPNCSLEQPVADTCIACGIVIKSYNQRQARERNIEQQQLAKLKAEVNNVDVWYRDLFDRRLASFATRALSLLILACMLLTCTLKVAQKKKQLADADFDLPQKVQKPSPEKIDRIFKERFKPALERLAESTDACISQNYNYYYSWYQQDLPPNLTPHLSDNLGEINKRRYEAENEYTKVPVPSSRYKACYEQLKQLSETHKEVCSLANSYSTHFRDFQDRLSNYNHDYTKCIEALNICKQTL